MYKVIRRYYKVSHGDITPAEETIGWVPSPSSAEIHIENYKNNHPGWEYDGSDFTFEQTNP